MHLKTNIEHSSVQIITLAICPLLLAVSSINDAVFFACGTIICLIISQLFLMIFNRYLSNDVKALLTAIISAMIITVGSIAVKEFTDKVLPDNSYLIVFSTTILNAEFIYFSNKAIKKHFFFNVLKNLIVFTLMMSVYSIVKEFMAFGTFYDKQLFKFDGFVFCQSVIFDLLWLASLCAAFDYCVRHIDRRIETKNMIYQKYIRIIRNEKTFQYDKLRREKLLANEIEVNKIGKNESEKIKQKEAENEAIESVEEVLSEVEVVDVTIPDESEQVTTDESLGEKTDEDMSEQKQKKKSKKKDKKKSKKGDKK